MHFLSNILHSLRNKLWKFTVCFLRKNSALSPIGNRNSTFCRVLLVGNSISDLVELIPSCRRLHSNEVLEVTPPLAERVTELIGVRANNFVTSSVTSAVHVDLAPAVSIESVSAIFFFFFPTQLSENPGKPLSLLR